MRRLTVRENPVAQPVAVQDQRAAHGDHRREDYQQHDGNFDDSAQY